MKVLVLGGTLSARRIADTVANQGHVVTYSLSGASSQPQVPTETPKVTVRSGGFGGADGLASFLNSEEIDLVIDATHPFADRISDNAVRAARTTGTRLLRYEREPWTALPEDDWTNCSSIEQAALVLPARAQVLVTIGRKHISSFLTRHDISGTLRMIEPPDAEIPANWRLLLARPPFSPEEELHLMRGMGATHLVAKNAGGAEGTAKLLAARQLKIPVILIAPPVKASAPVVGDIKRFGDVAGLAARPLPWI